METRANYETDDEKFVNIGSIAVLRQYFRILSGPSGYGGDGNISVFDCRDAVR